MAFNEKHHWVFSLVPTACDYAKLSEYFGKLRGLDIEALQVQGDSVGGLSVRAVLRANHHRLGSKMEISKTAISDMVGKARDTLFRVVNTISGCSGERRNMGNLREIGNSTIQRVTLEIRKKKRKRGKYEERAGGFGEGKGLMQLPGENGN